MKLETEELNGGVLKVNLEGRLDILGMDAVPLAALAATRLAASDALVLFTDGVTEARSPAGELFGQARLRAVLEEAGEAGALAQVEAIRKAVGSFAEGGPPADDLTLLVIGRPPEHAGPQP
jgi:sigma-B regulation protein RsbU (phosphoserine phosphatase)